MRVGKGEKMIVFVIDSFATKYSDPTLQQVMHRQRRARVRLNRREICSTFKIYVSQISIGEVLEQTGNGEPPISDDRTNGHVGNEELMKGNKRRRSKGRRVGI
jgi:hypothetical protein